MWRWVACSRARCRCRVRRWSRIWRSGLEAAPPAWRAASVESPPTRKRASIPEARAANARRLRESLAAIGEGDVDLHPVLPDRDRRKDGAGLRLELGRVARIAGGKMRQQQATAAGVTRKRRRLGPSRMPGLDRAFGLLITEGRLVHEEIRVACGVDRARAGARIAGDDDRATRTRRTNQL